MGRKRDPVLAVLAYFEEVELTLAQQALALAQAIVRKRAPSAHPRLRPRPVAKKGPGPVASVGSGE
jgi:hypothetical protein